MPARMRFSVWTGAPRIHGELLKLAQYGTERLEAACRRGLEIGARSYGSINSILANGLDRQPLPRASPAPELPLDHPNIRGSRYYH